MPIYNGLLVIVSNQSNLNQDLLLMAGYDDTAQAMFAATQFLVKVRGLQSGQQIGVSGKRGGVGTVKIIVMDDAWAAGAGPDGVAVVGPQVMKPSKAGAKKRGARKANAPAKRKKSG